MSPPITLKDLGRRCGLSLTAISYALRGSPKVSISTIERVRREAEACGYRPNPRIAELMAHIRAANPSALGDRLALVWPEGTESKQSGFHRELQEGAQARAGKRGYGLDVFWREQVQGGEKALARVLRSRGIAGVIFGPANAIQPVTWDWPWDHFAMAVIGVATWSVPLSRAGHHHYEAMRTAHTYLVTRGCRRPAAWLNAEVNARAHQTWEAAWLVSGTSQTNRRLKLKARPTQAEAATWLHRLKPDGLIVSHRDILQVLQRAGWEGPSEKTVLLDWRDGDQSAGIQQDYAEIAAQAIDLVVAQLQRNERGLPTPPRRLYFPGHWQPAQTNSKSKATIREYSSPK